MYERGLLDSDSSAAKRAPVDITDDADRAMTAEDPQEAETSAFFRSDARAGTMHLVIKEARLSVQGRADEASLRILLEHFVAMMALPAGTRIWLAAGITDMRRGFTGLSAQVQTALEQNQCEGYVFVFRGRRGDLIKVLWYDGDGLCLFAKRLERAVSCGRKWKAERCRCPARSWR